MSPCGRLVRFACSVVFGALSGCASAGTYVWYKDLSPDALAAANQTVINVGDVLGIRVLGHDEMATKERVRGDGRIALPIIGEVEALGKRPIVLQHEIEERLKVYIVSPPVTLNIEEAPPSTIAVLGEVLHPGVYPIEPRSRMAQALALGGGLTDYASRDRIFLLRGQPPVRIRFTYEAVTRAEGNAGLLLLRAGDVVVVE
jgi:polysaccharide biosynthesis/export protein